MASTLMIIETKLNIPGKTEGIFVNHSNEEKNSKTGYPGKREGS